MTHSAPFTGRSVVAATSISQPTPAGVPVDSLAGWIAAVTWLREDVTFGLDPRGTAARLADLLADMQRSRCQATR